MASRAFDHILRAIERDAFPRTRKLAWRGLYGVLSRVWRDDGWRFMNYGYVGEGEPFRLEAADEPERAFIGLYHQAVEGLPVAGARVLEVGCGRGGGARYLARYHGPAETVGLDFSSATVARARKLNAGAPGLSFRQGDAERLPFPDASFDIVINIESSHCYADVPAFAREVSRVLKPGGWFSFADMRAKSMAADLDRKLLAPGLEQSLARNISAGVVRALDAAEARKRANMSKLPVARRFMSEFSGAQGSILYKELSRGGVVYLARRYRKTC